MTRDVLLFLAVFAACAVEGVEAVTIVLAAGLARGWRAALAGVGAALVVLAVVVAALGPALSALPIDVLRLVVGGLLLVFGLQWLRKAILRAGGFKALHDEEEIFARELAAARAAGREPAAIDPYGFVLSFKGVLLEGLEVAFIAVTFGSNQHNVALAAVAAVAAVLVVVVAGVVARAPLSRVPENALKYGVGVMLTSFGMFWGAEGAGVALAGRRRRPARVARLHAGAVERLRRRPAPPSRPARCRRVDRGRARMRRLRALGAFLSDFVVGDDPLIAVVVVIALGATALLVDAGVAAWWLLPAAVAGVLGLSLLRAARE